MKNNYFEDEIMEHNSFVPADKVHETLAKNMLVDGFPIVLDLENSKGSKIVDLKTGESYIDFCISQR